MKYFEKRLAAGLAFLTLLALAAGPAAANGVEKAKP